MPSPNGWARRTSERAPALCVAPPFLLRRARLSPHQPFVRHHGESHTSVIAPHKSPSQPRVISLARPLACRVVHPLSASHALCARASRGRGLAAGRSSWPRRRVSTLASCHTISTPPQSLKQASRALYGLLVHSAVPVAASTTELPPPDLTTEPRAHQSRPTAPLHLPSHQLASTASMHAGDEALAALDPLSRQGQPPAPPTSCLCIKIEP
jgi:hypothetical protein